MKCYKKSKINLFAQYVWYVHPYRVYYGVIFLWYLVCIVYNVGVAEALGGEVSVAQKCYSLLNHKHLTGIKTPSFPYTDNIEGYQHIQNAVAVNNSWLGEQRYKYIPWRINQKADLPDFFITQGKNKGTQILTGQLKALILGEFNHARLVEHMKAYAATCDFIVLSCLQEEVYNEAIQCTSKLTNEGLVHPHLLISLINLDGVWDSLTLEQRTDICSAINNQRKYAGDAVYNVNNDAIQKWISVTNEIAGEKNSISTAYLPSGEEPNRLLKREMVNCIAESAVKSGFALQAKVYAPL